jgi:DNA polymerase-3 subunit alpha (Gram-positive type)
MYLYRSERVPSVEALKEINKRIAALGDEYGKPVAATCDVHFMNPDDKIYREILMAGEGFKDASQQAPLYFRTTEEMLSEFSYLPPDKAREVVITNTRAIADMCENILPVPDGSFPPIIPGSDEDLRSIVYGRLRSIYGDEPPEPVVARAERELTSIIKHGFSSLYIVAQRLVNKSLECGYLVGSRGSIGSSLAATMSAITEVNPLAPHYYCLKCRYSEFGSPEAERLSKTLPGLSGYDMPDKECPVCGTPLKKEGHDIMFETFLGFDCDKEPDIDLNFSGEYQAYAHAHAEEIFGKSYVFKAGTIGTLADKTSFGFVQNYLNERGLVKRNAEKNRLVAGLTGVKRTTGQHPGGLIVVPDGNDIHQFCPIQRPANDQDADVVTTHFDYHSALEGRLMKLDILGHDVPTVIKLLQDFTGVDPLTIDMGDAGVMELFTSPERLGVTEADIGCKTGTLGIPEFGTAFVRQMLQDTKPRTFTELVKISGLSHGTDVWRGNADELIKGGVPFSQIITTRDDILRYLMSMGVEKKASFYIMEKVRKGRGLSPEDEQLMKEAEVPDWYIASCKRVGYLFPKGHAVAYVMMSVRIGWYKIHYPEAFYAASFSVKTEDFNYETMCKGPAAAKREQARLLALGKEATAKDKDTLTLLELVLEMYARKIKFLAVDLYKSHVSRFIPAEGGIQPPLMTFAGLGGAAAQSIDDARAEGEFISIQDFKERTKLSKPVLEMFVRNGLLTGMQETNQLSLFF